MGRSAYPDNRAEALTRELTVWSQGLWYHSPGSAEPAARGGFRGGSCQGGCRHLHYVKSGLGSEVHPRNYTLSRGAPSRHTTPERSCGVPHSGSRNVLLTPRATMEDKKLTGLADGHAIRGRVQMRIW